MSEPLSAFDIAASGMAAQRVQMDVIANNLAHANVTQADGVPFRAQAALFESSFSAALDAASADDFAISFDDTDTAPAAVRFAGLTEQPYEPQYRLDPGNPLAAVSGPHKGYVEVSDVDSISQMIGLITAGRAYDADVASLQAAKLMDTQALEIEQP